MQNRIHVDLCFPVAWSPPERCHHREKPEPHRPNGIVFARSPEQLEDIPLSLVHPGDNTSLGASFHFLTDGCRAVRYHDTSE